MLRKIKIIFLSIIAIVSVWLLWSLFSHRMPWQVPDKMDKQLTILTFNTQGMAIHLSKDKKLEMLNHINSLDADIVCLQEVLVHKDENRFTLSMLREAMDQYPYTYYDFKVYNSQLQFGNVVFSRYPLINKQTIQFPSKSNISSQCDVLAHGDTLRLIINHLESFHLDDNKDKYQKDIANNNEKPSLSRKLFRATRLRNKQVTALLETIEESPHPVIAVGDFNSHPLSLAYSRINTKMRDCFAESSFGRYGSTFHRKALHARIDYIFASKCLTPISCRVIEEEYSDHDPVIGTIGWSD